MKKILALASTAFLLALGNQTNAAVKPSPHQVIERGSNYRVWQHTTTSTNSQGKVCVKTNGYTELGVGLCYQDKNGRWIDSDPQIVGRGDGTGQGQNGRHSVRFLPDINADGSILSSARGKDLRSHVLGICYYDWKNQREVQVGSIQSSVGKIVGKNQVIYADAFLGLNADVRYEYKTAGIGQDIIFREQLPSPADFQMDPASTRVEVWTEFLKPPAANLRSVRVGHDGQQDHQIIDFDGVRIGRGAAFATPNAKTRIPVQKQWQTIDGRTFLIESLNYQSIISELSKLPQRAQAAVQKPVAGVARIAKDRHVPLRVAATQTSNQKLQIASVPADEKGFVLDYETISGEIYGDYTFESGKTYYINDSFSVDWTLKVEGGTVVKFGPYGGISLGGGDWFNGPLVCNTAPYRPAVFTSIDDDTAGETISGSTGNPAPTSGGLGYVDGDIHDVHFRYLNRPVTCGYTSMENVQFIHCPQPLDVYGGVDVKNCLFDDFDVLMAEPYSGLESSVNLYNVSCTSGNSLTDGGTWAASSVNCIFTDVGDTSGIGGAYNGFFNADTFGDWAFNLPGHPFEIVGGGQHYVISGDCRGTGTSDIPGDVLALLATRTTHSPILITNDITNVTTFVPQVERDTNSSPDLGYHYDPIDYMMGGNVIATNVTLTNGVVIGVHPGEFGTYYEGFGVGIENAMISSQGTPTNPNRFVYYDTVQETTNSNFGSHGDLINIWSYTHSGFDCRFTHFSRLAGPGGSITGQDNGRYVDVIKLRDCEVHNGYIFFGSPATTINVTNCLFNNCSLDFFRSSLSYQTGPFIFMNCLFHSGSANIFAGDTYWSLPLAFTNCFFDTTDIWQESSGITISDYNAYLYYTNKLYSDTHYHIMDFESSVPFWYENGPLGNFYQSSESPLVYHGSQPATALGLSQYTVINNHGDEGADEIPEGTNQVSIGYHYVASDFYGTHALDSDSNGIPDYIQDPYGNMFGSPAFVLIPPTSVTVASNTPATFSVTAIGTETLYYQWQFNGTNIDGATTTSLTIASVQSTNAGSYSVIVTNAYGSATSENGILSIALAPHITADPVSHTMNNGGVTTLSVTATGTAPLSYQWRLNGNNVAGATVSYLYRVASSSTAGSYDVVITNITGSATSATAIIALTVPPSITTAPTSQTVNQGADVTFTVAATGSPAPTYQWKKNGSNISGATTSTLTRTGVLGSDSGSYTVALTNMAGTTNSTAILVVDTIAVTPSSQIKNQGGIATFSAVSTGTAPSAYQWQFNGGNISGATTSTFTIANVQNSDSGSYALTVTTVAGSMTSVPATLTVATIAVSPSDLIKNQADTATFTAISTGTTPSAYQWQKNGSDISDATLSAYTKTNLQGLDSGSYTVAVTTDGGRTTNTPASTLTVDTIAVSPASLVKIPGETATFTAVSTGITPTAYQWQKNGSNISGETSSTYTKSNVQSSDAGNYTVAVTTAAGSMTNSPAAILTVNIPPSITSQPVSQTLDEGTNCTFTVSAAGTTPLSYQWKKNGNNISGATSTSYFISSVHANDDGTYTVVVTNVAGSVTSSNATLIVNTAPVITTQPASQTLTEGQTATFSVVATSGAAPLFYQWQFNGTNIDGATTGTLSRANVQQAADAGVYAVVITNYLGSATSAPAVLNLGGPAAVVIQPVSQSATPGSTVTLSVVAVGDSPIIYQWEFNGENLQDATNSTLVINNVQVANWGEYECIAANADGADESNPATLTVAPLITTQPVSATKNQDQSVSFTVTAVGTLTLSYQWWYTNCAVIGGVTNCVGGPIVNATDSIYTIPTVQGSNAGTYFVVVSNAAGSTNSTNAVLSVNTLDISPLTDTINPGGSKTFTAVTNGPTPLSSSTSYWWFKNGNPINGHSSTYNATATVTTYYRVYVTNALGVMKSQQAKLYVSTKCEIATAPSPQTAMQNGTAVFSVVPSGTPSFVYQWRSNSTGTAVWLSDVAGKVAGSTTSKLTILNCQSNDEATYSVLVGNVVTGYNPTVGSAGAKLTVDVPPSCLTNIQPPSLTTNEGSQVTFNVSVTGTHLGYQWHKDGINLTDGSNIVGAKTTNLTILSVHSADAGYYSCTISNLSKNDGITCGSSLLTVNLKPVITVPPTNQATVPGFPVAFTVVATGTAPLSYQWRKNGTDIAGATSTSYFIADVQGADAGTYSIVVTNVAGKITNSAMLWVVTAEPDCGSSAPSLLGYWKFNSTTEPLVGTRGQLPTVSEGVQQVSGHFTNAISFVGFWPDLNYLYVDNDGQVNINCQKGAVAFWFKPNTDDIYLHQSESLVQVGNKYDCTGGWWSFGLDNFGTNLTFQTMSNGVQTTVLTTAAPNWSPTTWYHCVLNYSAAGATLYTNGVQAATTTVGVTNSPSLATRQLYGLTIGPADSRNCCEAPGAIDEFKTFNCPLGTNDILNLYSGQ